jgi:hypothetical protein
MVSVLPREANGIAGPVSRKDAETATRAIGGMMTGRCEICGRADLTTRSQLEPRRPERRDEQGRGDLMSVRDCDLGFWSRRAVAAARAGCQPAEAALHDLVQEAPQMLPLAGRRG